MDMISIIDEEGDFRARPTGWMRLFDDLEFYSGDFHSEQFHSGERKLFLHQSMTLACDEGKQRVPGLKLKKYCFRLASLTTFPSCMQPDLAYH
eukprot:scaffold46629_cov23-Tisochrysis_lutea.AAC.2